MANVSAFRGYIPDYSPAGEVLETELHIDRLWVVYPGGNAYAADNKITVCPISRVGE